MTNTMASFHVGAFLPVGRAIRLACLGALYCTVFAMLTGVVADAHWTLDDAAAAGMILVFSAYGVSRALDLALTALARIAARHRDRRKPPQTTIQLGRLTELVMRLSVHTTISLVQLGGALLVASAGLALAGMDPVQWLALRFALVLLGAAVAMPALLTIGLVLVHGWPMRFLALLYVCLDASVGMPLRAPARPGRG